MDIEVALQVALQVALTWYDYDIDGIITREPIIVYALVRV